MATETLVCAFDGHSWTRERKRGRKPPICPEHKYEGTIQPNYPKPSESLTEPLSAISDEALELLTGDYNLEYDFKLKLTYVTECLGDGKWLRENLDNGEGRVELMKSRQRELVREFRVRWPFQAAAFNKALSV